MDNYRDISFINSKNKIGEGTYGIVYKCKGIDLEMIIPEGMIEKEDLNKSFTIKIPNQEKETEVPSDTIREILFSEYLDDERIMRSFFAPYKNTFFTFSRYGGFELSELADRSSFLSTINDKPIMTNQNKIMFNRIFKYVMYHVISILDHFYVNDTIHGDVASRNFLLDLEDYDNNLDAFINDVIMNKRYRGWQQRRIKVIDLGSTTFIGTSMDVDVLNPESLYLPIHIVGLPPIMAATNKYKDIRQLEFNDNDKYKARWQFDVWKLRSVIYNILCRGPDFFSNEKLTDYPYVVDLFDTESLELLLLIQNNDINAKNTTSDLLSLKIFSDLPFIGGKVIKWSTVSTINSSVSRADRETVDEWIHDICKSRAFNQSLISEEMVYLLLTYYFGTYKISRSSIQLYAMVALMIASIFSATHFNIDDMIELCDKCYDYKKIIGSEIDFLYLVPFTNILQKIRNMIENRVIPAYGR